MHYDTLHKPPTYVQVDRPDEAFTRAAEKRGVEVQVLAPGERLDLGERAFVSARRG